jgi:hypothetical protein
MRETANGEYWIAMVATPGQPITTKIPLGFLPAGKTYNADVYADKKAASSMSRTTTTVEQGTTLEPTLQSGGGYLVRITEEEIEDPGSGEGEGTTYEISNESELALLREHPAATFLIKSNITMAHPWTPVQFFTGTIDGNGHTISNLVVEGEASKALVLENQGTIRELGFLSPRSVVVVSDPTSTNSYTQSTRVAVVAVTNDGLIEDVYTKGADVEGGWRSAPIAAENNGEVRNVYTVNSKVVANWEAGATVGWNSASGSIEDSYVAAAKVTAATSNAGIFTGYGYAGTKIFGDVVYSGEVNNPGSEKGRILARENTVPTYADDLSNATATINGATVTGGTQTNKNGEDKTAVQLGEAGTYEAIGWNFDTVWKMDATLKRPVLQTVEELPGGEGPIEEEHHEEGGTYNVATEADLALLREHPAGTFNLTADITMTHPWAPIPLFKGTLDGHGHTISGLEVEGSVEGSASKAFIGTSTGTIKDIGFVGLTSITTAPYAEPNRIGGIEVINRGTIEDVYMKDTDVEGGWRTAPIAAMNEGTIADSYTVDSKVVSNWESGGIDGWNSTGAVIKDDYVAGAEVDTAASNGGIVSGYGYVAEGGKAATLFESDVVYSGALTVPNGKPQGRINGQEHNGSPTYADNLALDTSTIDGATVSGGAANNRNGQDATEAELQQQSTYEGIGWDFDNVWSWSTALKRPVLRAVTEAGVGPATPTTISVAKSTASFSASATTPITSAAVLAAVGASADNGGTVTADVSAVNSDAVGSYPVTLTATDPFDSEIAPVTVTVNVSAAATQTSLTASGSSQTYGAAAPVTLTATVGGGDGALAGTVELDDGTGKLTAAPLEGGKATFTLPATLAVGSHQLTAHFVSTGSADSDSDSGAVSVTVAAATTTNPSGPSTPAGPSNPGKPTRPAKPAKSATKTSLKVSQAERPELTIKVGAATGKADGKVKVYVDSHVVKTLTVKNGIAKLALPLKQGTHKVKAVYLGDASLKGSTSATIKLTIRH